MNMATNFISMLMRQIVAVKKPEEVARELRVGTTQINNIKQGRSSLNPDKFGLLAQIHGEIFKNGISEKQIRVKYWEEKMHQDGISRDDFMQYA